MIPALLRENRSFRTFFLGQSVSLLGDQVSMIALPLAAVLVLDASPAQMGYLATSSGQCCSCRFPSPTGWTS